MRWLVAAVVVMGVLILGGTGVLVAILVARFHLPEQSAASASTGAAPGVASARPAAMTLDEPAGTRITGVSALGDRLVLALHGGGPDRVVVIDPATRRASFRLGLAR